MRRNPEWLGLGPAPHNPSSPCLNPSPTNLDLDKRREKLEAKRERGVLEQEN